MKKGNYSNIGLSFEDFFNLFVALNYIYETKNINIRRLRKFLKKYCGKDFNVKTKLDRAIKKLESKNIISCNGDYIIINNNIPTTTLIGKNGGYLNRVLEVINHYKEFDDQEINKIYYHMKNIEDSKEEKKEDKEYIINGLNSSSSDDEKSEVNFNNVGLSFNDFFNLFIALNYIQGKKALDIERFKRYIKKYYDDNIDVTEKLNNAISDLEKQQIIKRIAERDDVIFINDSIPVTPLISKNGNYVNQVLKVIDHYHNYEIKEIDKLYYLMCDHPEKKIK